ncbi:MAG: LPS export ABC transporter permease LptG [Syntrophus sp. (in: bacteria)]|nr:LPS export ABC transporter permease LptG [Syntrophus sp. (in: bacteria)]
MITLDRYITKEFLRIFFLVMVSFLSLFLIVEFFDQLRILARKSASFDQVAAYFFFRIPMMLSLTIPAAVLLSALLTFGSLSRNSEIVAMKANGISIYRSSVPVVILSFLITLFSFLFSELITPYANEKAEYIMRVDIQKKELHGAFKKEQIWYRGARGIYSFKLFDPKNNILQGITLNYLDRRMNLVMRVDADRAVWDRDHWIFYNLLIVRFDTAGFPLMERFDEKILDLPEKPSDFRVVQKDSEQMGYFELRKYVRKIRSEGYDATRYLADLHGKIAFPFVCVILAILGISFSVKTERSGGLAGSIFVGVTIGFSYWILYAFAMSLGRSGNLPPLLAAWLANLLFGAAALYRFKHVRT